jgi:hypothetical protein
MFIDPWSDVYACNVRPDLKIGNLKKQSWNEIWHDKKVEAIRAKVKQCNHNCWMVGSAKTAMRNSKYPKLPRWGPLRWVIYNKMKIMLGGKICFERYLDFNNIRKDDRIVRRQFFLDKNVKRTLQREDELHYQKYREIINR